MGETKSSGGASTPENAEIMAQLRQLRERFEQSATQLATLESGLKLVSDATTASREQLSGFNEHLKQIAEELLKKVSVADVDNILNLAATRFITPDPVKAKEFKETCRRLTAPDGTRKGGSIPPNLLPPARTRT